jgi:radical SAM protein with 4Fe4S-binding SPASM domain
LSEAFGVSPARASAAAPAEDWVPLPSAETIDTADPHARSPEAIPHVVAWNLTRRCNLACAHCYISAGSWESDDRELSTEECMRIADEILALSPSPMFVLSGGEPLVRDDLESITRHATDGGATVVIGTNGIGLTAERIASLKDAGVRGVAVSVDSLNPEYHDRFRHGQAALEETLAAVERLRRARLDFVIQTTLTRGNRDEVRSLADWAASARAVCFNLYFLVSTGRGERMRGLEPGENEAVLAELADLQTEYRGVMMVRSKCQPQIMRHVFEADPESPLLNYATRCPCGIQYCRITPEGKLTPCPYMPVVAGDLRGEAFADVWRDSPVFGEIRAGRLEGKCGRCEYRLICGGCRARAFAESGDYLGSDDSCAYEPTGDVEPILPRVASYGTRASPELQWSPEAEARLARVPSFVRGVVAKRLEEFARRSGESVVTPELMERVREEMPVDFSKRMPFFLRGER